MEITLGWVALADDHACHKGRPVGAPARIRPPRR